MRITEEQAVAIALEDGGALQAGAGSGKTFVIVRHLFNKLITEITQKDFFQTIENKQAQDYDSLDSIIKKELELSVGNIVASFVVVTYTKAATIELSERIQSQFNAYLVEEKSLLAQLLVHNSNSVRVTTIHGLFYSLLKEHLSFDIDQEFELINQDGLKAIVEKVYREKLMALGSENYRDIILSSDDYIQSLCEVCSDLDSKHNWLNSKNITINPLDLIIPSSLKEDIVIDEEYLDKQWGQELVEFVDFIESISSVEELFNYFDNRSFKIARSPSKKQVTGLVLEKYQAYKGIKDLLLKNKEVFAKNNVEMVESVAHFLTDVVKGVVEFQKKESVLTYSDLELFIYENIQKLKNINHYNYLIIDEFQDTSEKQFSILSSLVNSKEDIFVVGDIKQAIYGFRGGDVSVFKELVEKRKKTYELTTNFRSSKNVISFNNQLFKFLLQKKHAYDHSSLVSFGKEQSPPESADDGAVIELICQSSQEEKPKVDEINQIEARAIATKILDYYNKEEEVAILYKKLAPVHFLVLELESLKIPYRTMLKIPLSEDTTLILFNKLVEFLLNTKTNRYIYLVESVNQFLETLGVEKAINKSTVEKFEYNKIYFGLNFAFQEFLFGLSISNKIVDKSLSLISSLILNHLEDAEAISQELKQRSNEMLSVEYRSPGKSELVTIMTVHSSKGLQFKNVFIGGIYTNYTSRINLSFMRSSFSACKIRNSEKGKKPIKSLNYLLEELKEKRDGFYESIRLLYVACTRAESTLNFVRIRFVNTEYCPNENSWRSLLSEMELDRKHLVLEEEISIDESLKNFYYNKKVNVVEKQDRESGLIISTETSPTKLLSALDCSRKYYLESIIGIKEEYYDFALDNDSNAKSSIKRGLRYHSAIEDYIKGETSSLDNYDPWTKKLLDESLKEHELISEYRFKFEYFNLLLESSIDLILKKDGVVTEIWDFKTGTHDSVNETKYYYQLLLYLYGLSQYERLSDTAILLRIIYLDEQKVINFEESLANTKNKLDKIARSISTPWLRNENHCSKCQFNKLCNP